MHIVYMFSTFLCSCSKLQRRGSSGFGQKFVKSLPGNAGTLDVNDIQVTIINLHSMY